MAYYRECPYCGVNLDPGERCDCQKDRLAEALRIFADLTPKAQESALQLIMSVAEEVQTVEYR